jgi:hypothetical protein
LQRLPLSTSSFSCRFAPILRVGAHRISFVFGWGRSSFVRGPDRILEFTITL